MMERVTALVAALMVGACAAQGPSLNIQAEQMELALVECKSQLGFSGQLKTEVSFEGGVPSAKAVAFDKVTASDAAKINACGSGAQALNDGLLVVPMTATTLPEVISPAAEALPAATQVAAVTADPSRLKHSEACPIGVTGMYAGTLFCIGREN